MTSTPCLNDIFRSLSWVIVSVYLRLCLNLSPCSFISLMYRGTKYNVEDDDGKYDSEVIMNNNPCIIFAVEGSRLLIYSRRVSDNCCSAPNEYPYEPRHLSEFLCDSRIGLATLPGAPKVLSGALTCFQT